MAVAGFHSSGSQSPTSVTRTIEKVFDESQYTGEINLSGRKLKEYPKCSCKYDLIDITSADLSRNRFSEIPADICNCHSIERLSCYHNIIKCLPAAIVQLQNLVYLNLSRNQMSVIPPFIYRLEQLEVLLANNNKLVSLPEEIGRLKRLMQLDVSCNEITQLPDKIGDAESLQSLDVRKNLLVELPISICRLRLRRLNFSCNRIAHIPCDVRKVVTLEELSLDNNPLLSPPASICTRGIVHIMKFLNAQAARNETKKDVLCRSDFNVRGIVKRSQSCVPPSVSDETQLPTELSSIRSREPNSSLSLISSGYSSMADASEKSRWSHGEFDNEILELDCEPRTPTTHMMRPLPVYVPDDNRTRSVWNTASPDDSSRNSTLRSADSTRVLRDDQQQQQSRDSDSAANKTPPDSLFPKMTVRSPRSPGLSTTGVNTMDEITKELQRQRADYDAKRKRAEQLRLTVEETQREERRLAALRLQEQQQQQEQLSRINSENTKTATSLQSDVPHSRSLSEVQRTSLYSAYRRTNSDSSTAASSRCRTNGLNSTSPPASGVGSSATTDRLQSAVDSGSSNGFAMPLRHTQTLPRRCGMPSWDNNSTGLPLEEEFRRRHEAVIAQRRREAHNVLSRLEEMQRTRPTNGENNGNGQVTGKIEEEDSSCSNDSTPNNSFIETGNTNANTASTPTTSPAKSADFTTPTKTSLPPNCQKALEAMSAELNGANPVFTIRRNLQQQTDERLQVEELRKIVETVLKIKLPEDMKNALHDGVVLCHLVNHLRPHTVSSIHVPSSAVPKLTLAKCRRNVENFLLACRRIGLNQSQICQPSSILEDRERGLVDIATTVRALVECAALPKQSAV